MWRAEVMLQILYRGEGVDNGGILSAIKKLFTKFFKENTNFPKFCNAIAPNTNKSDTKPVSSKDPRIKMLQDREKKSPTKKFIEEVVAVGRGGSGLGISKYTLEEKDVRLEFVFDKRDTKTILILTGYDLKTTYGPTSTTLDHQSIFQKAAQDAKKASHIASSKEVKAFSEEVIEETTDLLSRLSLEEATDELKDEEVIPEAPIFEAAPITAENAAIDDAPSVADDNPLENDPQAAAVTAPSKAKRSLEDASQAAAKREKSAPSKPKRSLEDANDELANYLDRLLSCKRMRQL
jgi:hypothetical protein